LISKNDKLHIGCGHPVFIGTECRYSVHTSNWCENWLWMCTSSIDL